MTHYDPVIASRSAAPAAIRGILIAGFTALLAACNSTTKEITSSIPNDYRERHPITIVEGKQTLELFVGAGRGGLTPTQRAEVLAEAQFVTRRAAGFGAARDVIEQLLIAKGRWHDILQRGGQL